MLGIHIEELVRDPQLTPVCLWFDITFIKSLPNPCHEVSPLGFLLGVLQFQVLCSGLYLSWVDTCACWRKRCDFILLHVDIQCSQLDLLKRLSFLHCIFLTTLPKSSWLCKQSTDNKAKIDNRELIQLKASAQQMKKKNPMKWKGNWWKRIDTCRAESLGCAFKATRNANEL